LWFFAVEATIDLETINKKRAKYAKKPRSTNAQSRALLNIRLAPKTLA
jgi:hypothetical protein